MSTGPLNSPKPTTAQIVGGVHNVVAPAPLDGQALPLQQDADGNLLVNVAVGGGGGGSSNINIANVAGSPPALTNPLPVELSDGTQAFGTAGNPLSVNVITGGGSNASVGLTGATAPTSATEIGIVVAGSLQNVSAANPMPVAIVSGELSTVTVVQPTGTNLHTVTDTGSTTAVTGNVTVVQPTGTNLHVVVDSGSSLTASVTGTLTNNNAAPAATEIGVLPALANAANPSWTEGDQVLESVDLSGNQRVKVNAPLPAGTNVIGHVIADAGSTTAVTGNVTVVQPTGTNLHVVNDASSAVIGHVITDTGSVTNATLSAETTKVIGTVNQGTSPWVTSLASTTITGNVTVVQPTGTSLHAVIDAGSTTAVTQATGTNLHTVLDSGTLTSITNALPAGTNVIGHVVADTGSTTAVTGNVTVVQPTGTNLHVVVDSGSSLTAAVTGTLTNNNAAPAANNLGVLPALANAANPTWTEGDQVLLSEDLSGNLRVVATGQVAPGATTAGNPILIGGSTNPSAAGGTTYTLQMDSNGVPSLVETQAGADAAANGSNAVFRTGGGGNSTGLSVFSSFFNGTTWDRARSATIGNAVAATGIQANAAYGEYLSAAPAPTTGKYSALQTDYAGSLFVKPIRRSQTVSQATACTTTAATTVLAAQASGIFADISNLIMTVLAVAVDVNFTVTLSDGTKSYVYNLNTGGVTTPSPGTQIVVNFNPPLPATTAATAWTLTMSVAETVNVNIVAVLQKAS